MYLLQLFLDHFHWFCTISSSKPTFKWNLLCRASSKCWCFTCWLYWIGFELSPTFIAYPSEQATKLLHKIKMVWNFYLPGNDFWEARNSIEYTDPVLTLPLHYLEQVWYPNISDPLPFIASYLRSTCSTGR